MAFLSGNESAMRATAEITPSPHCGTAPSWSVNATFNSAILGSDPQSRSSTHHNVFSRSCLVHRSGFISNTRPIKGLRVCINVRCLPNKKISCPHPLGSKVYQESFSDQQARLCRSQDYWEVRQSVAFIDWWPQIQLSKVASNTVGS